MSKLEAYKAAMIARKAAAVGMTVEEFLARAEREAAEVRALQDSIYNRVHQWAVIASHAASLGRSFYSTRENFDG